MSRRTARQRRVRPVSSTPSSTERLGPPQRLVVANPEEGGEDVVLRLVSLIGQGAFDHHLQLLGKALQARWDALETARELQAMAAIHKGDWVRFDDTMRTKRLRGLVGKVVERDERAQKIVVCLGSQEPDDEHRHIQCSPRAVLKLPGPPE